MEGRELGGREPEAGCGRFAVERRKGRGDSKPETFNFLGFTHICGEDRRGRFIVRAIRYANG